MVTHLKWLVERAVYWAMPIAGDVVVDIGSNDGTTLRNYRTNLSLVGFDPTSVKFLDYYPQGVRIVPDFFSAKIFKDMFGGQKAKVVTSFAMFYDLEQPLKFVEEVKDILEDDGVWAFEQSYLPAMLNANSFDTVCMEHILFYAYKQIYDMLEKCGLRALEVELNETNGGSLFVIAAKKDSRFLSNDALGPTLLQREKAEGLDDLHTFEAFAQRSKGACHALVGFLRWAADNRYTVAGLGASTKGNVLLQYAGITPELIQCIGEVNPDKFGHVTPGSGIPIYDEKDVLANSPDFLVVLPWHFRMNFIGNRKYAGRKLVFPLPQLEIVRVPYGKE
jgi:NDP-4-keto-2,6-dideoxyhexose 3-C-methyltransferase